MQFRVVKRREKFYPQVRIKGLFLWRKWYRIALHPGDSYGLYPANDYVYGKSDFDAADEVCVKYRNWFLAEKHANVEVIPCNIV